MISAYQKEFAGFNENGIPVKTFNYLINAINLACMLPLLTKEGTEGRFWSFLPSPP